MKRQMVSEAAKRRGNAIAERAAPAPDAISALLGESTGGYRAPAALVASILGVVVATPILLLLLAQVVPHRDPDAPALAREELKLQLSSDERVLHEAVVEQRLWWDYFRPTTGVLAATGDRVLFVGVAPDPLVGGRTIPREYVHHAHEYTRMAVRQSAIAGKAFIELRSPTSRETYYYAASERGALDALAARAVTFQDSVRVQLEAERAAAAAAAEAARRAVYYVVLRGDALDAIAARHGAPVDSLMAWNNLTTSRIVVGQRLLVRPEQQ